MSLKANTLARRPLFPQHVGFERLFDQLMGAAANQGKSYPPHNVICVDENEYRIDVAVAGFSQEDLTVELTDRFLTIEGARDEATQVVEEFLYKGISSKSFKKRFNLADNVRVIGSKLSNGILSIILERVVPDEQKPMLIDIERGD
jgi:molecular chaperone IbpA